MLLKDCLEIKENMSYCKVKVIPKSRELSFFNIMDDWTLKIRLTEVPERGKANKQLIEFFSKELKIKKDKIKILSGQQDQIKFLRIDFWE